MTRSRVIVPILLALALGTMPVCADLYDEAAAGIRTRFEAAGSPPVIEVRGERILASKALPRFYEEMGFQPAWFTREGAKPEVEEFLEVLRNAYKEGLRGEDYHLPLIESIRMEVRRTIRAGGSPDPIRVTEGELLLSDAFLVYASHLLSGRVHPETFDSEWHANLREGDVVPALRMALGGGGLKDTLQSLRPPFPAYGRFMEGLEWYRRIAASGGWESIPEGEMLEKGARNPRVGILRKRLTATGELSSAEAEDPELFDEVVDTALRAFQGRHGLQVDGVLGGNTLEALNVPVEDRIEHLELNLERTRWLPQQMAERFILVNTPGFMLHVFEDRKEVLSMKVVVGKTYRRTPVFSDSMTYLVFSPYWNVPNSLAVGDILPKAKKNPSYLNDKGIRIFRGWGSDSKAIDPATVDWSQVSGKGFPYRFRQDPGPKNSLGRVKFMFPNKYNVYLHDTPAKQGFARTERAFSSGCIRVERPTDLAGYLLKGDDRWTPAAIEKAMNQTRENTVTLSLPIDIHIMYWTAWVSEDGQVHFRKDLYGRDEKLQKALDTPPQKG